MITLTYSRLRTVTQNGTTITEVEQTGSDILEGGVNAISERKKLYCTFDVETAAEGEEQMVLAGSKLYVSFAMFLPKGLAVDFPNAVPNTGFSVIIPQSMYEFPADGMEMQFYSLGVTTPQNAKNYKCYFHWITETSFAIELEYYNTFDEDAYMNGVSKSNQWRFFSEYWNQNNTNTVSESVYAEEKELRMISHLIREELTEDGLKYTETQEHRLYSGQIDSFDSEGEVEGGDGEDLETISTIFETPVTMRIYTAENTIDKFYAKLIRIQERSELDFVENYDIQETQLEDGGDPTPGENAFIGPVVITRDDAEGFYQLEFSINPAFIDELSMYRIIINAYETSSGEVARSTTSGPIPSSSIVSYCGSTESVGCASYEYPTDLLFTATLADCNQEFNGNFLTCVIEERMRSKLIVDYSDNRWKNNIDCRKTGSVGGDTINTNDIRKYLESIDFEIYQEGFSAIFGGTTKHVHDFQTVTRNNVNQYTSSSSNLSFTVDTVNEQLIMYYDWRNRNENNTYNLYSYFNGQQFLPIDNQYWGGKSFFIKWRLNFNYYDFRQPFTESLDIIQKMVVKDYDTNITVTPTVDQDFVCPEEVLCYDGSILFSDPEDYKLINIFELSPGQLYEEENWVPAILPQLSSIYFNTQDADYTGGDAHFCIDPSTLNVNQSYNFSTIAKLT